MEKLSILTLGFEENQQEYLMNEAHQIGRLLDELTFSKIKDQSYLKQLKSKYQKLSQELSYIETQLKKVKNSQLTPTYDIQQVKYVVLEELFLTSQNIEIAENLERNQSTHLFLGFFTQSVAEIFKRIYQEEKPLTTLELLKGLVQQRETLTSRLLQKYGLKDLGELEKISNTEHSPHSQPYPHSEEIIFATQKGLKWARKLGSPKFNTEHLLLGILENPTNSAFFALKKLEVDIFRLNQDLSENLNISEEEISMKKPDFKELERTLEPSDEQVRVLKEIRDLLRQQGRQNYEGHKKAHQENNMYKWLLIVLTFLLFVLSLYVAGFIFLAKTF